LPIPACGGGRLDIKTIDRILKDILRGMLPQAKSLCPMANVRSPLYNADLTVCDLMPENDINTLSYPELINDPTHPINVKKDRMSWEEYSKQEEEFEVFRQKAEAAIYDLMIEERNQEEAELKKKAETQIRELLNDFVDGNRQEKLQRILESLKKDTEKLRWAKKRADERMADKLQRERKARERKIRQRVQKLKKEAKDNNIQDLISQYGDKTRRDSVLEYLDIQKEKKELIALFEEYEKLKKSKPVKKKIRKKKKRRGRKKKAKPVGKYVWKKPEITDEDKKKVKKRAKGLAAYLERFL